MNRTIKMLVLPAALALAACGNTATTDGGTDGSAGGNDLTMTGGNHDLTMTGGNADLTMTSTVDMAGPPAAPLIGTQIDRLGRATINVAVTDPFNITTMGQDKTRDAYNADSNEATWQATWKADLAKMLAIYDGADTVCGNQGLACGMLTGCASGSTPAAGRYDTLATVLADDRIYLNTASSTCNQYLGVELNVVGLTNTDCGGRTPTFDVVDLMYTTATVGAAGFPSGGNGFAVTDGVSKDGDNGVVAATFPFLPAPNP